MPPIKKYKTPELTELRKQQRECMQRLRAKQQNERLWKQRVEHNAQIVVKGRSQIYEITKNI